MDVATPCVIPAHEPVSPPCVPGCSEWQPENQAEEIANSVLYTRSSGNLVPLNLVNSLPDQLKRIHPNSHVSPFLPNGVTKHTVPLPPSDPPPPDTNRNQGYVARTRLPRLGCNPNNTTMTFNNRGEITGKTASSSSVVNENGSGEKRRSRIVLLKRQKPQSENTIRIPEKIASDGDECGSRAWVNEIDTSEKEKSESLGDETSEGLGACSEGRLGCRFQSPGSSKELRQVAGGFCHSSQQRSDCRRSVLLNRKTGSSSGISKRSSSRQNHSNSSGSNSVQVGSNSVCSSRDILASAEDSGDCCCDEAGGTAATMSCLSSVEQQAVSDNNGKNNSSCKIMKSLRQREIEYEKTKRRIFGSDYSMCKEDETVLSSLYNGISNRAAGGSNLPPNCSSSSPCNNNQKEEGESDDSSTLGGGGLFLHPSLLGEGGGGPGSPSSCSMLETNSSMINPNSSCWMMNPSSSRRHPKGDSMTPCDPTLNGRDLISGSQQHVSPPNPNYITPMMRSYMETTSAGRTTTANYVHPHMLMSSHHQVMMGHQMGVFSSPNLTHCPPDPTSGAVYHPGVVPPSSYGGTMLDAVGGGGWMQNSLLSLNPNHSTSTPPPQTTSRSSSSSVIVHHHSSSATSFHHCNSRLGSHESAELSCLNNNNNNSVSQPNQCSRFSAAELLMMEQQQQQQVYSAVTPTSNGILSPCWTNNNNNNQNNSSSNCFPGGAIDHSPSESPGGVCQQSDHGPRLLPPTSWEDSTFNNNKNKNLYEQQHPYGPILIDTSSRESMTSSFHLPIQQGTFANSTTTDGGMSIPYIRNVSESRKSNKNDLHRSDQQQQSRIGPPPAALVVQESQYPSLQAFRTNNDYSNAFTQRDAGSGLSVTADTTAEHPPASTRLTGRLFRGGNNDSTDTTTLPCSFADAVKRVSDSNANLGSSTTSDNNKGQEHSNSATSASLPPEVQAPRSLHEGSPSSGNLLNVEDHKNENTKIDSQRARISFGKVNRGNARASGSVFSAHKPPVFGRMGAIAFDRKNVDVVSKNCLAASVELPSE